VPAVANAFYERGNREQLNAIEFINTINLAHVGGLWIFYRRMVSTPGGKKNRDQGSTATKGGLCPQSRTPFVSDKKGGIGIPPYKEIFLISRYPLCSLCPLWLKV
jgi:hypothetical protein